MIGSTPRRWPLGHKHEYNKVPAISWRISVLIALDGKETHERLGLDWN